MITIHCIKSNASVVKSVNHHRLSFPVCLVFIHLTLAVLLTMPIAVICLESNDKNNINKNNRHNDIVNSIPKIPDIIVSKRIGSQGSTRSLGHKDASQSIFVQGGKEVRRKVRNIRSRKQRVNPPASKNFLKCEEEKLANAIDDDTTYEEADTDRRRTRRQSRRRTGDEGDECEKIIKDKEKHEKQSSTNTNALSKPSPTSSEPYDSYLTWNAQSAYDNSVFLPTEIDKSKGIQFHWTIRSDSDEEEYRDRGTIQIGVAVKIDSQQGWAEIGFSEHGGRRGADVVHFTRTGRASSSIVDGYVLDDIDKKPIADRQQDWKLIDHFITNDGYLIFEARRALDTKDSFDRSIIDDSGVFTSNHKIFGAWGSSPDVYYHDENRVKASLKLFHSDVMGSSDSKTFFEQMSKLSNGSATLKFSNYVIPSDKTTYYSECFEIEKVFGHSPSTEAMYIIGFENIVTSKYVHHMGFRFIDHNKNESDRQMTWTLNSERFRILPDDLGKKIGGADNFPFICFDVHYENEDQDAGVLDDDTAIQLFYSNSPRKYTWQTLEFLSLGDGAIIGSGLTRTTFFCPSPFNRPEFQQEEFTIIKTLLHAHKYTKRIVNQVVRDGEVIHELSTDYWDFNQGSASEPVHRPFQVKRTDSFRTMCYTNTTSDVKWGGSSNDEMCNTFILFELEGSDVGFPKDANCLKTDREEQLHLTDESQLNRVFGKE